MPLEEAHRDSLAIRLHAAYKQTSDWNEARPWAHELVADYQLGQEWPVISAAYSGIEQTLKLLIALDMGKTIEELINLQDNEVQQVGRRRRRPAYLTHRLGFLFSKLDPGKREAVEEDYARWQSLHSYVDMPTCEEFLNHIQGDGEDGYQNWRYCLVQDQLPVTNSADAMLAAWAALLRRNVGRLPRIRSVEDEVVDGITEALNAACGAEEHQRAERGEELLSIAEDRQLWAPSRGHLLNATARALSHYEKHLQLPNTLERPPLAKRTAQLPERHQGTGKE